MVTTSSSLFSHSVQPRKSVRRSGFQKECILGRLLSFLLGVSVVRKSVVVMLAICLLISSMSNECQEVEVIKQARADSFEPDEKKFDVSTFIDRDIITFRYNEDFDNSEFNGTGTFKDPYIIENLFINSTTGHPCIYIGVNVTYHYKIINCVVTGTDGVTGFGPSIIGNAAINLVGGTGEIRDCVVYNCRLGIGIEEVTAIVDNCEVLNYSYYAIKGIYSIDLSIANCRFNSTNIVSTAVDLWKVKLLSIFNCTFYGLEKEGILGIAFWIRNCGSVTIQTNFSSNDALFIVSNCNRTEILESTFRNHDGFGIRVDAYEIYIHDSQFLPLFDNDTTIKYGLSVGNVNHQVNHSTLIEFCNFTNRAFRARDLDGSTIRNCTLYNSSMSIRDSYECQLYHNFFDFSYLEWDDDVNDSIVYENTLYNCINRGITPGGYRNQVYRNTVIGTEVMGSKGITLSGANLSVYSNTVMFFETGIYGAGSQLQDNSVTNNTIMNNEVGIHLGHPVYRTRICYNYLINNDVNAQDNALTENYWDDGVSLGNYWSNIFLPGEYQIPGAGNSVDHYAQPISPGDIPTITSLPTSYTLTLPTSYTTNTNGTDANTVDFVSPETLIVISASLGIVLVLVVVFIKRK